jgi:hypothetical protein
VSDPAVFVRRSRFTDMPALGNLAARCGRNIRSGPYLMVEVRGKLVAATPLEGGTTISDPTEDTEQVEELLACWAASLRREAA